MSDFDWLFWALLGVGAVAGLLILAFIGLAVSVCFEKLPIKKLSVILGLLVVQALACLGAQGDCTFAVETNGWVLRLTASLLNTNGNFFNGFRTNNTSSPTNGLTIQLVSMGFDSAGNGIRVGRTVYGTKVLRMPYPSYLTNDIVDDGAGNCTARIALSDYVFAADSNIVATITAGAYAVTNGNRTNCVAASGVTVTNLSVLAYPPPVCNWAWPGYNILPASFTARVVGDAAYGIAAVRFVCRDTNSLANTNWQTVRQIDRTLPDKVPVSEYLGQLSCAGMSNGSPLRLDFTVYPKVGSNTCDTMDGVNLTGPFYAPQTNICDAAGIYGKSFAVVSTNGVNASGVVVTNWNPAAPPAAFLDMGAALNAIVLTNNILLARSNTAGSFIYLTNGTFAFWTTAVSKGNANLGWLTIAPYPGLDSTSCSITGHVNVTFDGRAKLTNIFLNDPMTLGWFAERDLWFDRCAFNCTQTTYLRACTNTYFTDCTISNLVNGFWGQSAHEIKSPLIRGNDLTGQGPYDGIPYTVIGNGADKPAVGANRFTWTSTPTGSTAPVPDGIVFQFNRTMSWSNDGNSPISVSAISRGAIFEQNIYEGISFAATAQNVYLCISSNLCTNVIWRCNDEIGERSACFYNEGTQSATNIPVWKVLCFINGSTYFDFNLKTDTFNGFTQDGKRIGNWSCLYGVGWSQNMFPEIFNTVSSASGSFLCEFPGMNTYGTATGLSNVGDMAGGTTTNTFWQFVNYAGMNGLAVGAGNGDYHKKSASPLTLPYFSGQRWLEYDIEGNARGISDPPGAYSSANPRKGGFF